MSKNEIIIDGDVAIVKTNKGDMIIDAENLDKLQGRTVWVERGYARICLNGKKVRVHRLLMGFPSADIDHRNRNKLDNRMCNLRACTVAQNNRNRGALRNNKSGLRGVSLASDKTRTKPWRAVIETQGKKYHLGYFYTKEEAYKAYCDKACELFGEYAGVD